MGGKALTVLDDKLIHLELTDNRGFNADELDDPPLTIAVVILLPLRGASCPYRCGWQESR